MKISIQGLGGRLQRARKATGLSQEAVAGQVGVSWMTVHRWERSQRSISDKILDRLCDLYDKPLRWFLTLEDGDLEQENRGVGEGSLPSPVAGSAAAQRISSKIAAAPADQRPMLEKIVEDMLDGLRRAS